MPSSRLDDPALIEETRAGAEDDELSVIVRLSDPTALPRGARVITRFGDIATVRVRRAQLQDLADSPAVTALEASRNLRPSDDTDDTDEEAADTEQSDELVSDVAAPSPYTRRPAGLRGSGRGCVVAALDWGIDPAHPAFQRADGTTRIISLWDQRGTNGSGAGNRWGYGRMHSAADIDRALKTGDPYGALDYHPADADIGGRAGAHGSHVLDIAAGSGRGTAMPGVAPEADLVFVHLARTTEVLSKGNLGDSASVLEALDHVFAVAGDRPCVVNMSVGAHGGPHDGSTLVELGIDQAVSIRPGRAVVNSAGNYRVKKAHAMGRISPGEARLVRIRVPPHDTNDSEIELFYSHIDRFTVEVLGPAGEVLARVRPGEDRPLAAARNVAGHVHHLRHGTNGDHHVDVLLKPDAPGGIWTLRLTGDTVHDGRYHAWIERDRGLRPTFAPADVVTSSTTGTICNGKLSITCGCANPHRIPLTLATFSSSGPTRDGRVKPELVAPGYRIRAARSTPAGQAPGARSTLKSGTSMAAPHVAGTIALMFEAAGKPLEIHDTRALLFGSVDPSPFFDRSELGPDLHRFGYGLLDIVAAERAARAYAQERDGASQDTAHGIEPALSATALRPADAAAVIAATQDTDTGPHETDQEDAGSETPAYQEHAGWETDEGDVQQPVARSHVLKSALATTPWIRSPGELHQLALQSLGIDPAEPLVSVADPGEPLRQTIRAGDVLVRAAPVGGGLHASVVIADEVESGTALVARGVPVEPAGEGTFVEVVEVPPEGGSPHIIGRRLTDRCGRVPRYQRVLRVPTLDESAGDAADTDLEETISIDDVAVEMNGLNCRFLAEHRATKSSGDTRTFASGAVVPVEDWHGTDPDATIDGFSVPKLAIDPAPVPVATIRRYNVALAGQRRAVLAAQRELSDWLAREGSYRRNRSFWERQRTHLASVASAKSVIYSQLWVRDMMYNRFDATIGHWTTHYNTSLRPTTDLDPNIVKSMAYQESRLGTSGRHLMPPPSDWSSRERHPVRSRFNIIQAIDSWAPQQWLMMKEMAPEIFRRHGLNALEARAVWIGMSEAEYLRHATYMTALREFFEHRSAGNNLMGTAGRDLHEDYGYWIRAAIRWLFDKYSRLPSAAWREAVRAYNGSGPAARRYRDEVMARVGALDPFTAREEAPEPEQATFVCVPAQVPDPVRSGLHPRVHRSPDPRRSLNASVGHAQELLNLFLPLATTPGFCVSTTPATTTFLTTSLATLTARGQNPLVVDCKFGQNTELATRMFQACADITQDGVIGWNTWALLELLGSPPRPTITARPCCILAPDNVALGVNILDPAALGTHGTGSEVNGLVYCGRAGFVDLGHARDMVDLVKFLHDQFTAVGGPPLVIRTLLGIVSIRRPPANALETAAAIAFEDARGHEIVSWDTLAPGGRNSSFSPEDLVSNFLGTVVGRRAIARVAASGVTFSAAATTEIDALLTSLDVQSKTESENAFNLINHRWVDFTNALSLTRNDYLLRRNFTRTPFKAGHPSDAATPAFVNAAFSATSLADFDYFHLEGGKVLPGRKFADATTRVRTEARAAFGVSFDLP